MLHLFSVLFSSRLLLFEFWKLSQFFYCFSDWVVHCLSLCSWSLSNCLKITILNLLLIVHTCKLLSCQFLAPCSICLVESLLLKVVDASWVWLHLCPEEVGIFTIFAIGLVCAFPSINSKLGAHFFIVEVGVASSMSSHGWGIATVSALGVLQAHVCSKSGVDLLF